MAAATTIEAFLFAIWRGVGNVIAVALVAPSVRYASVRAVADAGGRLDRRFTAATDWPNVLRECREPPAGPYPKTAATARLLVGEDRDLVVWFGGVQRVAITGPAEAAVALDAALRGSAGV